jgi:predicted Rossmann fold nucleotide-binding protein DprA/Smf involved in DNA uptake
VIAGGIDVFYPPENEERQQAMTERGLVVAEMPPGTEPRARHFPYRNRIIAGMASGTVVVEAAPRSGSLITARLAAEAGREVMAVPGSPLDPRAQGCNQLIRDGATLVQNAADVVEATRPFASQVRSAPVPFEPAAVQLNGDEGALGTVERPARAFAGPRRRGHPPVGRDVRRRADGLARTRPRRAARPPCRRQGQPAPRLMGCLDGGNPGTPPYAYA